MRPVIHHELLQLPAPSGPWAPSFPNPADFAFNYFKLLDASRASGMPIGQAPQPGIQVAIIGAGCAGLTAARELFRAGYAPIIFEASDRIGGRHFTDAASAGTSMEMGAMRFPFFSKPGSQNAILDYYLNAEASALLSDFPNPGAAPGNTGIYMNDGYGPNGCSYPVRDLLLWKYGDKQPPTDALKDVHTLVTRFITLFTQIVGTVYGTPAWPALWAQMAGHYDKMTFSDLVFTPAMNASSYQHDGWVGGFGMTEDQSQLFYTIGSGDGSWGAFYEIGAMWFIRCVMFGFNSNLQTVAGIENAASLPCYQDGNLGDSLGNPLVGPTYRGIQSLDEWLFYVPAPGATQSLYQGVVSGSVGLYTQTAVRGVTKTANGITIATDNPNAPTFDVSYVIATPQIWANQLSITMNGFDRDALPLEVNTALADQHVIASAKVFFPLKSVTPYWQTTQIPQILVTDTFVQDAYGIQWDTTQPGALLASYTWEDDALKLLPFSDAELGQKVLAELDKILTSTGYPAISPLVDAKNPTILQWTSQPGYNGCAKLYRQRNWSMCYQLLTYNQQHSSQSGLYLAGETYGVEGGWTEPALRGALDAVIHLIENSNGSFNNGFSFDQYPLFAMDVKPNEQYPAQS